MSLLKGRINALSSKHRFSDAAIRDILDTITDILPIPNKCPSIHDMKVKEAVYNKLSVDNGDIFIIPIGIQISNVLNRFPSAHTLYTCDHDSRTTCDLSDGYIFPQVRSDTVFLLMHTDGLSPIISRRLQIWPITFSVLNLRRQERRKAANLILAGKMFK